MSNYAIDVFKKMLDEITLIEARFGRKSEQYLKAVREYQKTLGKGLAIR